MSNIETVIQQELEKADQIITETQKYKTMVQSVARSEFFKDLLERLAASSATQSTAAAPTKTTTEPPLILSKKKVYIRSIDMACDILYRNPTTHFDQIKYGKAMIEAGHVRDGTTLRQAQKNAMGFGGHLARSRIADRVANGIYQISALGRELIDAANGDVSTIMVYSCLREGTKVEREAVEALTPVLDLIVDRHKAKQTTGFAGD